MKKLLILTYVLILSMNVMGTETVKFWYSGGGIIQYVDYEVIQYESMGVNYKYLILDIPVSVVNTTYWTESGGAWNVATESNWLSQYSGYLWQEVVGHDNDAFVMAYNSFTDLGYRMFIEVIPDTATVNNFIALYGLTVDDTVSVTVYDTTYTTVCDTVTMQVYDTVFTTVYDTVTMQVYDTIFTYETVYDTIFTYETVYDTIYTTVRDTVFEYQTVYDTITVQDTIIYEEYISVTDTLIIDLDEFITSAYTGVTVKDVAKVYPNPASEKVYIEADPNTNAYKVDLFDASGVQVLDAVIESGMGHIDVNDLTEGLYILVVTDFYDNTISTKKLLVQ